MPLTDSQNVVLGAFADSITAAATAAGIDPAVFAGQYGSGGASLVIARTLQARAAQARAAAMTASQAAETTAQAYEAQAASIERALSAQAGH